MSKAFPTKEEREKMHMQWALGLTIGGAILWVIAYACSLLFVYGSLCPVILGAAVFNSWKAIRCRPLLLYWLLLICAVLFFIISLLPWGLPIAR